MNTALPLRTLFVIPLLALAAASAHPTAGQTIAAAAIVGAPKASVRINNGTERVGGWWAGGAISVRIDRWTLAGEGTRGSMSTSPGDALVDRDVGEVALKGAYEFPAAVGPTLGYVARAFRSSGGYQRWNMLVMGVDASRDLGAPVVHAIASLAALPMLGTAGPEPAPNYGLRGAVGLVITPERAPLELRLAYRVERFHFPAGSGRSEQFESLTFSIGVRAHRSGGRWTVRP